jgi:hypothetical protein
LSPSVLGTPQNIVLVVSSVGTVIAGMLCHTVASQPQTINLPLDAPLVMQPGPAK